MVEFTAPKKAGKHVCGVSDASPVSGASPGVFKGAAKKFRKRRLARESNVAPTTKWPYVYWPQEV